MKIELLQLLKHEGAVISLDHIAFSPQELEIDRTDAKLTDPVVISGRFLNLGSDVVELTAAADYRMELTCARCLKVFPKVFSLSVHELFREAEDWEDFLQDGMVDVTSIIRHALLGETDFRYLCREDCKGLCVKCGKDLNDGACDCREEPDPRLAVLQTLLNQ